MQPHKQDPEAILRAMNQALERAKRAQQASARVATALREAIKKSEATLRRLAKQRAKKS
jgi:hypothetical protein